MKTRLLFAALILAASANFYGQTTYNWNTAADGNLDDPESWSPSGFNPTNAQMIFEVAGSYQVGLENDMTSRYVILRGSSGLVTFDLGTQTLTLSSIFLVSQNAQLNSGTIEGTMQVGNSVSDKSFTVSGANSIFRSATGGYVGRSDSTAAASGNSLTVTSGATFDSGSTFIIGDSRKAVSTNNNTVTVSGAGTTFTAGAFLIANLSEQLSGQTANNNRLVVTDGATATLSTLTVTRRAPGVTSSAANGNQVIVGGGTGPTSLTIGGAVAVGAIGTNNIIRVESNGTVTATGGATTLNSGAGTSLILEGGKYLAAGQKFTAYGNSVIAISQGGQLTTGELDLRSSLTTTGLASVELTKLTLSNTSKINIAISSAEDYGRIEVANGVDELVFMGTLNVTFADGYEAVAGSSFQILSFGQAAGEFTAVDLPDLAAGLAWNTESLYSNGTITVIPEPNTAMLTLAAVGIFAGFRYLKRAAQ